MHRARQARADDESSEVNVTPMLDVVFILLIFFVVTASFIKPAGIDLSRFDAPMSTESASSRSSILIALNAHGQIWINGRHVSLEALGPNIEKLHAENPTAKVIISAEPEAKNGLLVRVLDVARGKGLEEISLAAAAE